MTDPKDDQIRDDTTPPDVPETNFGNMAEQSVQDGSGVEVAHIGAMRVKERLHERMMRLGIGDIPPIGIVDDTTPPAQWTSIADALPPQGELVLFAAVIDDQWVDEPVVGRWRGQWTHGAAIVMDYGEDDDWLPCTHWRAVPPLPDPVELTMSDIGPQRAAPKSVRQVEAECKQVRREAAEVGLEEFPLRSAIETGSALVRDNRALRDLAGRLLFQLRSTARAVPLQIEQDCRRLGVPQLGQQSRDSRRVDELIGMAGG